MCLQNTVFTKGFVRQFGTVRFTLAAAMLFYGKLTSMLFFILNSSFRTATVCGNFIHILAYRFELRKQNNRRAVYFLP
jgi:hypothetical protein